MSWYRASTISLTNGSTAVTGAATDFIANCAVGEGLLAPDGKVYEIAAIVSATALTLGSVYLGSTASGQSYAIIPSQSYLRDLALQAATLVNDYQSVLDSAGAGKFGDGTLGSPGIQFASDSNTGLRRTGTDAVALVTGGVDRITVDAAGAVAVASSLSVAGSAVPTLTSTSTLTNKTLTAPVLANPSYSGATANGGTVTTIDINGGTIDGTVIGGSSAAAGSFTTLSATSIGGTILSTSNSTNASARNFAIGQMSGYGTLDLKISAAKDGDATVGATVLGVSASGLAVTGALSATQQLTLGDTYDVRWGDGSTFIAGNSASDIVQFAAAGAERARVSSTGLAVTGALSATGDVTVSGASGTRTLNIQSNTSGDPTLTLTAAGDNVTTIKQVRGSGRSRFTCGANYFDLIDGTGLAVTGALSATGAVKQSNGTRSIETYLDANGSGITDAAATEGVYLNASAGTVVIKANSADAATVSSTGLTVTGVTTSTQFQSTSGAPGFSTNNQGTGSARAQFTNSGGTFYVGLDNSGGGLGGTYTANLWHSGAYSLVFGTNNLARATIDASGNLGIGVTPRPWFEGYGFDLGSYAGIQQWASQAGVGIHANSYRSGNGVYTYKSTYFASMYLQGAGTHTWYTAPSGTAGNAITFTQAMTLDASSNLTVTGGITTGSYTVATRPAHAAGRIIHVTDGGAGAVFQGSAGGSWVNLG